MITLITGTPGAGKTLYTVAEELPKFGNRPLFVDGIPELTIPHLVPAGDLDRWHEWIPDGAVLVIDEVQRVWRPRGTGSAVPAGVAALETHRHKGVDIVLITQHPNLLDANVRRLIGRHLHVRRVFGWKRAIVYEWDAATDPARVATAIKRSWKYPKKAFSSYKSASEHTARGQRVPLAFVIAALGVVAVPVAFWFAGERTVGKWFGAKDAAPVALATEPATAQRNAGPLDALPALPATPARLIEATTPTDPHNPLSAPLYAAVVPPVVAPEIVGCIASRKSCACYSQQSTPVWLPDGQCRDRAAGKYFDPYRQNAVVPHLAYEGDKTPASPPPPVLQAEPFAPS